MSSGVAVRASNAQPLMAIVAHELRNPLASLRLSLDILIQDFDALEPDSALRLIQRAQRSVSWLQGLTENLTSAVAAESGQLPVRTASVDLRECIDQAILLVRGLLDQRRQSVRIAAPDQPLIVKADAPRVVQILANLLCNASRYSVDEDQIELRVAADGQHLCVRVVDHGPGISAEDQQRIFGAWIRAQDSAPGGMGLGLNIVQTLVHQHGGRVGVESTLGHGAAFWFTLLSDDAA